MSALHDALASQLCAAIDTLEHAVRACPPSLWDEAPAGGSPFWHIAYHTAFYLDIYTAGDEAAFHPPEYHVEDAQFLAGEYPHPPFRAVTPAAPLATRDQVLAWIAACRPRALAWARGLTESDWSTRTKLEWMPLSRGELLLYVMRHTQHHAAQLSARLRNARGRGVDWVGEGREGRMKEEG